VEELELSLSPELELERLGTTTRRLTGGVVFIGVTAASSFDLLLLLNNSLGVIGDSFNEVRLVGLTGVVATDADAPAPDPVAAVTGSFSEVSLPIEKVSCTGLLLFNCSAAFLAACR